MIIEGVRGYGYQGDISIDDITFTSGCKRLGKAVVFFRGTQLTGLLSIVVKAIVMSLPSLAK